MIRIISFFISFTMTLFFNLSVLAFNIDDGSCDENRIYNDSASGSPVYFWKIFYVDGHETRKSEFEYGYSYGYFMDCVREKRQIQNIKHTELMAARYAQEPNIRMKKYWQIDEDEFCDNAAQILIQYCDPNYFESSTYSTEEYIEEEIQEVETEIKTQNIEISSTSAETIKDQLANLKNLLDEGLISQEQYDLKSADIIDSF